MHKFRDRFNGIILITCLIFLTIVIMIVGLVAFSAKNGYMLSTSYSDDEKAYLAALSGLEYVRARLSTNKSFAENNVGSSWMTSSSADTQTVFSMYDCAIKETNGKVIGFFGIEKPNFVNSINGKNESKDFKIPVDLSSVRCKSKFEIMFVSPTDSTKLVGGTVSLDSIPTNEMAYASCNNMNGSADASSWRNVKGKWIQFRKVDSRRCHVIVKGTANKSVIYLESLLNPSSGSGGSSSVVMSRKDINAVLTGYNPLLFVSAKDTAGRSSLKTDANFYVSSTVKASNPINFSGENSYISAKKLLINNEDLSNSDLSKYGISLNSEEKVGELIEKNANFKIPDAPTKATISHHGDGVGLVYVNKDGGKWYRYSFEYENGVPKPMNDLEEFKSEGGISVGTNAVLHVKGDVVIDGNIFISAVDDLRNVNNTKILPPLYDSILSKSVRPQLDFLPGSALYVENSTPAGKNRKYYGLTVQGTVTGRGNIYSTSNINMQGGTYFSGEKGGVASCYATEDFNLLPNTGASYPDSINQALKTCWSELREKNLGIHDKKDYENVLNALVRILDKNSVLRTYYRSNNISKTDQRHIAESFLVANTKWSGSKSNIQKEDGHNGSVLTYKEPAYVTGTGARDTNDPYRLKAQPFGDKSKYCRPYFSVSDSKKMEVYLRYGSEKTNFDYLAVDGDGKYSLKSSDKQNYLEFWIHDYEHMDNIGKGNRITKKDNNKYESDIFIVVTLDGNKIPQKIFGRYGYRKGNMALPEAKNPDDDLLFDSSRAFYEAEVASNINELTESGNGRYVGKIDGREVPLCEKNGDKISLNIKDILNSFVSNAQDDKNIQTHDNWQYDINRSGNKLVIDDNAQSNINKLKDRLGKPYKKDGNPYEGKYIQAKKNLCFYSNYTVDRYIDENKNIRIQYFQKRLEPQESMPDAARDHLNNMLNRIQNVKLSSNANLLHDGNSAAMDCTIDLNQTANSNIDNDPFALTSISPYISDDDLPTDELGSNFSLIDANKVQFVPPSSSDTYLKGMIYCKNGNFNGFTGAGILTVAGGIVTFSGAINLDVVSANMLYDPDFAGLALSDSTPMETTCQFVHMFKYTPVLESAAK